MINWIKIQENLTEVTMLSTFIRLLLAMICGGVLGIERGKKNRPAGFRTYMLVCVGATLVMIINQYISDTYCTGDPARLGAQVISGIGFLGAGTIITTGRNRVKGLTTAAGLWATACVGLAIGIGFYFGAIIGCLLIFIVMSVLHRMDMWMVNNTKVVDFYIEFDKLSDLGRFITFIKSNRMSVDEIVMTRSDRSEGIGVAVLFTLRLEKKCPHSDILAMLSVAEGVSYIEKV